MRHEVKGRPTLNGEVDGSYSRDLKIAAMREIDSGRRIGEVSRHLEVSPKLLERWRGEWQARGELAFPVSRHSACAAIWNVISVLQPNTPVVRQM